VPQVKRRGPNSYTIIVYLGRDENGKKRCYNETFHGSPNQARHRAAELQVELKRRTGPKKAAMNLAEYFDFWLKRVKDTITERTYETYDWHVRRMVPLIGKLQLYTLSPLELQENLIGFEGLSPRSIRGIFGTLRTALRQAQAWGIIGTDPTKGLRSPRVPRKERRVLRPRELMLLLETAKEYRHYLVIRMLATTGMRLGEVLGLKWRDVDFEGETVVIQRAVDTRNRKLNVEPKTESSRRIMPLDPETTLLLKAKKRELERAKISPLNILDSLVFQPEPVNGKLLPMRDDAVRKTLQRALKKAGLSRIRVHDLRHTAGSILLASGVSLPDVADFLGHGNPATTAAVYAHPINRNANVAKVLTKQSDKMSDKNPESHITSGF